MKYIEVEHPHGFLIWKGKQKAIANSAILPVDEQMLLVCNGEAYGKLKLAQPAAVTIPEFDRLKDDHCIRTEERKMFWPDSKSLYIHRISEFEPFSGSMPVNVTNGQAEFVKQPSDLNRNEARLVQQAEKLPKTIILNDDGLVLDYDTLELATNIDYTKALQAYEAAINTKSIKGRLPLYRLALVRQPHLIIERTPRAERDQPLEVKKKQAEIEIEIEGEEMPYSKVTDSPDCDGVAVVKDSTGEVMGCHDNEEQATAQIAALYAAEEDKSSGAAEGAESDASVEAKNAESEKAVTKSEADGDHPASHYLVVEDSQMPTTWHLRVRNAAGDIDHRLMGAAWAALHGGYRGNTYEGPGKQEAISKLTALYKREGLDTPGESKGLETETDDKAGRRLRRTWRQKLQAAYDTIKEMLTWADYDEEDKILIGTTGFSIKQINGQPWFTAWSTNAFQDREQEIFSTKGLERYVAEAERLGERGFFNVWHIPGTDFARKEWQGVIGRILVESGPFLDDDRGRAALKFFTEHPNNHPTLAPEGWGMSPEYRYLPEDRDDKIYDWLWITRSSVLAKSVAANIYTKGGLTMALTTEQMKAAEEIFGAGLAAQIIQEAETESKTLEEAGVAHKSNDQAEKEEKPAPATTEINIETVVAELVKQLDLSEVVNTVQTVAGQVSELGKRLDQLEQGEKFKEQDQTTRYVLQLKRASEAEETILPEGDKLREQKPKETEHEKGGSLAGKFFTPLR